MLLGFGGDVRRLPGVTYPDIGDGFGSDVPIVIDHVGGQVAFFGFVLVLQHLISPHSST